MQHTDWTSYNNGEHVTEEQAERLDAAAADAERIYPRPVADEAGETPEDDYAAERDELIAGAAMVILGGVDLADIGADLAIARDREATVLHHAQGAALAAAGSISKSELSRRVGLSRPHLDKLLG